MWWSTVGSTSDVPPPNPGARNEGRAVNIPQIQPWIDDVELSFLNEVITSTYISENEMTERFLAEIRAITGAPYALAVSNGTIALVASLLAAGIGPGDEVIVPDLTFIASANAVRLTGAEPIFCDVRYPDGHMTAELAAAVLSERTRALMPVHLYGGVAPMTELMQFANEHDLIVIEDAAESMFCRLDGHHSGCFGAFGTFSLFANKIITCGEGGIVVTDSEERFQALYRIKNHGRDRRGTFVHEHTGYNFCFTDLQAAVGMGQLTKVDKIRASKQRNFDVYRQALEDIDDITLIEFAPTIESNYWFNNVLVADPEELRSWLAASDIETRRLFYPLHRQPCFADRAQHGHRYENTDRLYDQGLSLPSGATLTDAELDRVVDRLVAYSRR